MGLNGSSRLQGQLARAVPRGVGLSNEPRLPDLTITGEVLGALEHSPAAVGQKILLSGRLEFGNLQTPDLIDGVSELFHDVKAIENVQGLRSFLRDHLQIRVPHVATDEPDLGGAFFSEHAEEPKKRFDLSFRPAPERPPEAGIELIDHAEVLVPFEDSNLVDSDLGHTIERAMGQAIVDEHFDGSEDTSPAGFKDSRDLVPGEASGPLGQKDLVGVGHLLFPIHPGHPFHLDSVPRTTGSAGKEKLVRRLDSRTSGKVSRN